MYPNSPTQATTTITGAIALLCTLIWAIHNFTYAGTATTGSTSDHAAVSSTTPQELENHIFNSTLGVSDFAESNTSHVLTCSNQFEKLFVINLPERTDHRDALALTGALSGLQFEFMEAVHGDTIPDKALPPNFLSTMNKGGKGVCTWP